MTPEQARALSYLSGRTWGATAWEFARAMWPDSASWHAPKRPGVGVCYAARVMLNRLIDEGWVRKAQEDPAVYVVTRLGVGAVGAHQARVKRAAAGRVHHRSRPCRSQLGNARRSWKYVTCPACLRHRLVGR